jgi:hypothetical protein
MKHITLLLIITTFGAMAQPKQLYKQNKTYDYYSLIDTYKSLDKQFQNAKLLEYGKTDAGKPLHLFVIDAARDFSVEKARGNGKAVVFINNGIHPGEPAGIDASVDLAWELLSNKEQYSTLLNEMVICIVPVYNIGGMLNRSPYNRANQYGPEECGFRGNARNIDLNRDYIICQTANARSLVKMIREWDPDVFLETHTTDGSDHQQTITLITTAHQDLPKPMGEYIDETMRPALYKAMKEKSKYKMCPYVHVWRKPPDDGFQQFLEMPRFSTGYVSLFNSFAFMTENHIFKKYEDRVLSCKDFMHCLLDFTYQHKADIISVRHKANLAMENVNSIPLHWQIDSSKYDLIDFYGYTASYPPSKLTGQPLLKYDRKQPYNKKVKYFNHFNPKTKVELPDFYIIPQAYGEVIDRLKINGVKMRQLQTDSLIEAAMYYIDDFESYNTAYNGHYPHFNITVHEEQMPVKYYAGDYIVQVTPQYKQYLAFALEPQSDDSFFAWNLFDEILQSREYFSPFIFEERAIQILDTTSGLKEKLQQKIKENPSWQTNTYLQMRFIYQNSPYFEKTYKRYPVGRVFN